MARVKRAVASKKHRKQVLERAKGYYGNKSRSVRAANEQVMRSGQYAFRDRRAKKGDFRRLWITRINAACRLPDNDISYSKFIDGLNKAGIEVDRDTFYPESAVGQVVDLQLAYDESWNTLNEHRRKSPRQYLFPKGTIDQDGIDKIEAGIDGAMIEAEAALKDQITPFPHVPLQPEVFHSLDALPIEIGRQLGVSSFDEAVVPDKDMRAREVDAIQQSGSARTGGDARRFREFKERRFRIRLQQLAREGRDARVETLRGMIVEIESALANAERTITEIDAQLAAEKQEVVSSRLVSMNPARSVLLDRQSQMSLSRRQLLIHYRPDAPEAMSAEKALGILKQNAGTQFHPTAVAALEKLLEVLEKQRAEAYVNALKTHFAG